MAPPTVHSLVVYVLAGITREHNGAPQRKAAFTAVDAGTLRGTRNRAIILLGFVAALRRSEIIALDVEDFEFDYPGVNLRISSFMTDQDGRGKAIAIPLAPEPEICAVTVIRQWLESAQIEGEGPLFRSVAVPRGRNAGRSYKFADCQIAKLRGSCKRR